MPGQVGAANSIGAQRSGGVTALEEPVGIPSGGDAATPDVYIGSAPALFSAGLSSNLSGDQMILAYFGSTNNRQGGLQAVVETTDFGSAGIQSLSVTRGELSPIAFNGVAGNSGSSLLADAIAFSARLRCYSSGDVTTGYAFRADSLGGASTGNFIGFVGFHAPNPTIAPDGVVKGFVSGINGAANFAVSCEGNSPVQFLGAKVMMPNLPTANPNVAGQLWSDAGTLKISAG